MNKILFVNHRQPVCGVQQMGSRYYRNLAETKKYEPRYIDIASVDEFTFWYSHLQPAVVIYNFYSHATMPWFKRELLTDRPMSKHVAIFHELPLQSLGFDLILHQDPFPSDKVDFPHWALPRSIPLWEGESFEPSIPTFGSFGFGLGGKGFDDLVLKVNAEYDVAAVHLHIPFAHFGDIDGAGAKAHAENARKANRKPGVILTIDHDFWEEEMLLNWLASNTCNCFFYHPHHGRGISGTLDYALAVRRPIAITHSEQFRHVWSVDSSFTIENASLHEIIELGHLPTNKFREMWSRETFVKSFEDALASLGV